MSDTEITDVDIADIPRDQAGFEAAYPDGVEVKIRHGLFSYFEPKEGLKHDGTWGEIVVECFAFYGQVVKLTRLADVLKGLEFDAFEDPNAADDAADDETEDVELSSLGHDELVDWLMSTGRFDGQKKPTVDQVVEAAGEDEEFAQRLIDAETEATGGNPRAGVTDGLGKVTGA